MSNLLSIHNSKNQIGIGTNSISVSSSLTIKENSKRYIVFNTGNNSIDTYRPIELEETTTLSTVKTNSISSPKLLYIASNNLISSLSFSSSVDRYFKVSNVGGLGLVDRTGPTMIITSTTSGITNGITTNNNSISLTFTSNEAITNFTSGKISVSNGSISNFSVTSSTVYTATFTPSSDGVCAISVGVNTVTDVTGNNNTETTQFNWTYDSIAPTVTSVTSTTTNNSYGVGNSINITLTFTKNVTLSGGNILITMETGTTDQIVSISSVSDSITAVGTYIVQSGDTSNALTVNSIGLSDGTLQDIAGNDMIFNIVSNLAATSAIVIETTAPTITSITSTTNNGSYRVGDPDINITINFSESVTLIGSILVTLETGTTDRTVSISDFSDLTTKAGTYQIISGDTTSALTVKTIELVGGATLKDSAGNDMSSFNIGTNLTPSSSIIIDTTAPTVTNIINNSTSTLAKAGVEVTLTITANEAISQPTVIFNSGNTSVTNSTIYSGSGTTWTAKYTVHTNDTDGNVTITVTATDLAGNSTTSTSIASGSVTVDTTAPVLSSASSIGTTTDTTPNLTFSTTEIGTITSSLAFTSSTNANVGNNTITFSTLSNNTYSNQWIKITDSVGNVSNILTIPTFIIATNPYGTTDIRYYNWIQDQQLSGVTRGDVGYVRILGGPDSNPGNLQPNGDYRGQPGSLEDWQLSTHSQTYDFGYIVMPNPSLPNTVTPTYNNEYGAYSPFPADWGQSYNNYRYKITRQSNGNFILENPWQGLHFDTYNITGSSTQWEFIKHSSNATNGDPLWRIRITTTDSNGKYLSIRTVAQSSYAGWVYGAYGYGYSDVLPQRTGWSKQLWRLDFL